MEGVGTGLKEGSRSKSGVSWMRRKVDPCLVLGPQRQGQAYLRRLLRPLAYPILDMASREETHSASLMEPQQACTKWAWLAQTLCLLHLYPRVRKPPSPL